MTTRGASPARRTRKPTRVRLGVDDRRRQLLELGRRAFTELPYDAVSTDAIAARAGISRGLIFHYFPTKRDYYLAVLRVAADQLVRETVLDTHGTPPERLVVGLRAYFRFVDQHAEAYATLLRAGGGADPVVQELVEATRRRFIDTIRGHLAPPVASSASDARLERAGLRGWIGLVEALSLDWIEHRDLGPDALVALAARAMGLVVPGVTEDGGRARRPRARGRRAK
jgi:AcrR family transcriptional regulator